MDDAKVNPDLAVDLSELKEPKAKRTKKVSEPEPKKRDREYQLSKIWPLPIRGKVKVKTTNGERKLKSGVIVSGKRVAEEREEQKKRRATRLKARKPKHGSNHKQRVVKASQKRRKKASLARSR